jgi:hypothetical protein
MVGDKLREHLKASIELLDVSLSGRSHGRHRNQG